MTTTAAATSDDGPRARVVPLPAGPYEVTGPLELLDPHGRAIEPLIEQIYLCRCGRSATKPFCDGSHARVGWTEGS